MAVISKFRKSFGRSFLQTALPDLVEIQYDSFRDFLQMDTEPKSRKNIGLQNVFKNAFPVKDFAGLVDLEFEEYVLGQPKYNVKECMQRRMTYSAPLRLKLKMLMWEIDDAGKRSLRDIKEQEVFIGDIPLMTERGTFIAAGVERVIVSQMHRAQGVVFSLTKEAKLAGNEATYTARIIPEYGTWIDFEEAKDTIYVRIDRRRKVPATVFLRCLPCKEDEKKWNADPRSTTVRGMTDTEILSAFYKKINLLGDGKTFVGDVEAFAGLDKFRLPFNLLSAKGGKELAKAGDKLNAKKLEKIESASKQFAIENASLIGQYLFDPIMNGSEILFAAGTEITEEILRDFDKLNIKNISIIAIDHSTFGAHMRNTLVADKLTTREEALIEVYNIIRPGERPTVEAAANLFVHHGFDENSYDLSAVGRFKMNMRLKLDSGKKPEDERLLSKNDVIATLQVLMNIIDRKDEIDDIDSLSNRRVRSVGELFEQQFRTGMQRIRRNVRELLSGPNVANAKPQDIINAKPMIAQVSEFLGTSQLSQFMEHYNSLSALENKRRISAFGPGGLNRERAGFDVRDVHPTHYGRLCPIQSPEGQNIGLINQLSSYARVNPYGFVETPYYVVKNNKITDTIVYLTADEEAGHKIVQGNTKTTPAGTLSDEMVTARVDGDFMIIPREEVDLIDVAPRQIVSVATGLIPFLENDDAHRALMGSNMLRQAVPLLRMDAPLVGTGIEREVARDSREVKIARFAGVVDSVDANRIVVKRMNSRNVVTGVDIYNLEKFERSNNDVLLHQKPLVKIGDRIAAGDVIADSSCSDHGELALGKNVTVAFLPWHGYNYEDAIVVSERISRDDVFTSIKIIEKSFKARDTQLGEEKFTRDVPNVSEESLKNLDESGIIYIGANVKEGDILIGCVSPKVESMMTPEELLLSKIFGDKALAVKDSSLRVDPGEEGTVIGVNVLTRHGVKKDERTQMIEMQKIAKINQDREDEINIIERGFADQVFQLAAGQMIINGGGSIKPFIGKKLSDEIMESIKVADVKKLSVKDNAVQDQIEKLREQHLIQIKDKNEYADFMIEKAREGNSLNAGVLKEVKVFIAQKIKLQPGDKMAGRHGNKGIVSIVVPVEDMPYTADGTPVDIVLNPLGVPSRMNIGQVLEVHLGAAAHEFGKQIGDVLDQIKQKRAVTDDLRNTMGKIYGKDTAAKLEKMTDTDVRSAATLLRDGVPMSTPTFDGATVDDIHKMLKMAGLPESGQVTLFDGMTGEKFARPVTVGTMYMLKLHHIVEEKIHARSIGKYSLITQQPMQGKARGGGQRFGEMEAWAIEAHGASHILREMTTTKSDDIEGRNKMFEAIITGDLNMQSGTPEGFNVLSRELRGLGLSLNPKKI